MPDGHLGQDPVDQVRRRISHASAAARRTEAAALAGECDEAILPAVVAAEAEEAMGQDTAAKERPELLLDEAGSRLVLASRFREKALEVLSCDLVQKAAFGLVALMLDGVGSSGGRVLCDDPSNFGAIPGRTACRRMARRSGF